MGKSTRVADDITMSPPSQPPTIRRLGVPKPQSHSSKAIPTSASSHSVPNKIKKTTKTKVSSNNKRGADWTVGQKHDTPPVGDSLRLFYESLLRQKPESRMALKWCLEHGLLKSKKAAEAVLILEMEKKMKVK